MSLINVLHGVGPFGNEDPKKHIKLYISLLRFDEDMDNHEEVWLEKGGNLVVINGGILSRPVCSYSSLCPCVFRDEDVSSPQV